MDLYNFLRSILEGSRNKLSDIKHILEKNKFNKFSRKFTIKKKISDCLFVIGSTEKIKISLKKKIE